MPAQYQLGLPELAAFNALLGLIDDTLARQPVSMAHYAAFLRKLRNIATNLYAEYSAGRMKEAKYFARAFKSFLHGSDFFKSLFDHPDALHAAVLLSNLFTAEELRQYMLTDHWAMVQAGGPATGGARRKRRRSASASKHAPKRRRKSRASRKSRKSRRT